MEYRIEKEYERRGWWIRYENEGNKLGGGNSWWSED
jgi:hypothetical protein